MCYVEKTFIECKRCTKSPPRRRALPSMRSKQRSGVGTLKAHHEHIQRIRRHTHPACKYTEPLPQQLPIDPKHKAGRNERSCHVRRVSRGGGRWLRTRARVDERSQTSSTPVIVLHLKKKKPHATLLKNNTPSHAHETKRMRTYVCDNFYVGLLKNEGLLCHGDTKNGVQES